MAVLSLLLHPDMTPFTIALLLVAGLLLVELVLSFVGASLLGGEVDADIDADTEFDAEPELDIDADGEAGTAAEAGPVAAALSWLGIGKIPLTVWIAGTLTGFGLAGYAIQVVAEALFGGLLPVVVVFPVAAAAGLAFGQRFARLFGRLVPRHESYHVSRRSFGGRRGVIAQGTARRGRPAQAKVRDGYGETHYLQVEPFDDDDEIGQGTEIAVLRAQDGSYRAIRLTDAETGAIGKGE